MEKADLARADLAAEGVLERYGVFHERDLDLSAILLGEGLVVEERPLHSAEAWLLRRGGRGLVRVREDMAFVGQKRFAIAHELGHWLLHRDLRQEWVCTAEDLSGYAKSPEEVEANRFAASLLLPDLVLKRRVRGLPFGFSTVLGIAEGFSIGPTVVARRWVESDATNALLVAHDDGLSRYYVASPRCGLPPIKPRMRVPRRDLAPGAWETRRVPLADWYADGEEAGELIEHSLGIEGNCNLSVLLRA